MAVNRHQHAVPEALLPLVPSFKILLLPLSLRANAEGWTRYGLQGHGTSSPQGL